VVTDILNEAWNWFTGRASEIVGKIVDTVLDYAYKIASTVDGVLETLWQGLAKPVLQDIFPILRRILSFPGDALEFIFGKVFGLFKFLFGVVSVPFHEIELKIYEVVVDAVSKVYRAVASMFVNVYNAVRSVYVGVRDVTTGFILSTVRRIRERLHTIITVDLWILGCWKAFQGSLESFSFGDFLKTAVLCLMAPVASGYIAGIITSLTPTPGTEFPGFIPSLEFPELRSEDMPRFSVVAPPPVSFPTVGVSTLPFVLGMDLSVEYGVGVPGYVLSDSVGVMLSDLWSYSVVVVGFVLSDSVSIGLSDVWSYVSGYVLDLSDDVGLSLVDGWSYGLALNLSLGDSVDLGLSDGWGWSVTFNFDLSDSVGVSLSDGWVVWMDEIQLVSFAGVGVFYPAIVDVNDLVVSTVAGGVSYPAIVDVNDLIVSTVVVSVSYPAVVDVVDLIVGAGVSVG
jgi:hypothetical protein